MNNKELDRLALQNMLKDRDVAINKYKEALEKEKDDKQKILDLYLAIINSKFWKLTSPIRSIFLLIKIVFNREVRNQLFKGNSAMKSIFGIGGLRKFMKSHKIPISDIPNPKKEQGSIQLPPITRNPNSPIPNIIIDDRGFRINLVTDTIIPNEAFSKSATAIVIAAEIANSLECPLRIITRNSKTSPLDFEKILQFSNIKLNIPVMFFDDSSNNSAYKLEIGIDDVFIATSWWSAEAIKKTTLRKQFFYIVDEVETFLYPKESAEYLKCLNALENSNVDYIIGTSSLLDYFNTQKPSLLNILVTAVMKVVL